MSFLEHWSDFFVAATAAGYIVAVFLIPRVILERKHPSASVAWLTVLLLVPVAGVLAYLLIGEKRIRKHMREKAGAAVLDFHPADAHIRPDDLTPLAGACAMVLAATGAAMPIGGNRVRFLAGGEEAFESIITLIGEAKHYVHAQFYVLSGDPIGRRFLQALRSAAKRGVRVKLLLDGAGTLGAINKSIRAIREAGGKAEVFLPLFPVRKLWSVHLRNHRKVIIVDGKKAFTGGMNIGRRYMGVRPWVGRWKDMAVVVEGPAVSDLQAAFLDDWRFSHEGENPSYVEELAHPETDPVALSGGSVVQVAMSGPDRSMRPIHQGLFAAITQAKKRVWIQTPYFVPDEATSAAILSAAMRGVDVRLMVPDVPRSNFWPVAMAGRSYCREAAKAGVKVLVYTPTHLHTKLVIADNDIALVGSSNVDMRSFFLNFEGGLFLYGKDDVAAAAKLFLRDAKETVAFEDSRAAGALFGTRLVEDTCRIFSPLF